MKLKAEKKANIIPICILFVTGIVIVFFCVKAALENITRDGAGFFLFAGIGAFFVFICIMHFITEYKNLLDIKRVKREGIVYKGTIIKAEIHPLINKNGVHPQTAICQYSDGSPDGLKTVKSDYFYNELGLLVGREVDIYIDKENSDKYYVDMSKLADSYEDSATKRQTNDFRE